MEHKEVVKMASNLADHPHVLKHFMCDRLVTFAANTTWVHTMSGYLEVLLEIHEENTTDIEVFNNKHIRIIEDLTEATPFSLSRVTVFRSSNFAFSTRVIMFQLNPESMSTDGAILGKEWHIAAEGHEDYLLIMKVLHWIHQHDRVTVRTLRSRYVELNVGPSTRPAECTIKAATGRSDVLNALKLIEEMKKQQNLEITITELDIHGLEINDRVFTKMLLDTLKFNTVTRSITIWKDHIPRFFTGVINIFDFEPSPCIIASLGNLMTSLEKLNLEKCNTTHQVADQMAQSLPYCRNLKSMHLGFNKATGLIEKLIGRQSAPGFHFLQNLDLTDANLSKVDISSLSQAVGSGGLSKLNTLGLSRNVLTDCMANLFGTNCYPEFTSLQELDLSQTSLNNDDLLRVSAAVKHRQLPKLRRLNLAGNDLEEMEDAVINLIENCREQYKETILLYFFDCISDSENSDSDDSNDYFGKFRNRIESLCRQTNVEICDYYIW